MSTYISIIGDIKNSRKITNRLQVQEKLKDVLAEINKKYKKDIKLPFVITLGDEFQALLFESLNTLEIIYKIKVLIPEIEIRFGIGIGNLKTKIDSITNSLGTDGPVWWDARQMIDELKNSEKTEIKNLSSIKIKGFRNTDIEALINQNFVLLNNIESKYTKIQKEIVGAAIKQYGFDLNFSQTELSKKLNKSVSSLNKTINSAKYYDYIKTMKIISNLIVKEIKQND